MMSPAMIARGVLRRYGGSDEREIVRMQQVRTMRVPVKDRKGEKEREKREREKDNNEGGSVSGRINGVAAHCLHAQCASGYIRRSEYAKSWGEMETFAQE